MTPRLDAAILEAAPGETLGVAISGGSDSTALLLLMQDWATAAGRGLAAITIDHGLRPEAAAEAADVAEFCAARGIPHAIRRWAAPSREGGLQAAARAARRALIAGWAAERGIAAVALGHTRDDQAETFLLRLARGSGVDGLSAMAAVSGGDGLVWLRPLLDVGRADLQDYLRGRGVGWIEDPSNADPVHDRVRARAALRALAPLGLGTGRLAATAARMARARAALETASEALARRCLRPGACGDAVLDPEPWAAEPEELRLRLLAGALCWVAGARYRPRLASLEAAAAKLRDGGIGRGLALHGCVLRPRRGQFEIRREPRAVAPHVALSLRSWDGRWRIEGPDAPGLEIGALGDAGLAARPGWRDYGFARETLLASPALWDGARLVAAPLLDEGCAWRLRRIAPLPAPWGHTELR